MHSFLKVQFIILLLLVVRIQADDFPDVVIIANGLEPESLELAEYYASIRSIPEENIISINLPREESVSWTQFENNIYLPLLIELESKGWLENFDKSMLFDRNKKSRPSMIKHNIDYVVIMKGAPLKIEQSSNQMRENLQPIWMKESGFRMDYASVDSEISVMLLGGHRKEGWLENPFFNNEKVPSVFNKTFLKVSRIDGPSYDDCKRLIRNTLIAENKGLIGRAYIDRGEDTKIGEEWLKKSANLLTHTGYDLTENTEPGLIDLNSRFDMPAFYFGWYSYNARGPWQKDSVLFPPGSIFLHIHSYSGTTVRSTTHNWVGPMVRAGVTATVGNVNEPYLEMTHHPHLLLKSLIGGSNWADAIYYSLPVLSWQSIAIGDPLYRPFKVTLKEQMTGDWMKWYKGQYIAIRYMNTLIEAGYIHQAMDWGMEHLRSSPGRVVALKVAQVAESIREYDMISHAIEKFIAVEATGRIQDKLLIRDAIQLLEPYEDNEKLNALKVQLVDVFEKEFL